MLRGRRRRKRLVTIYRHVMKPRRGYTEGSLVHAPFHEFRHSAAVVGTICRPGCIIPFVSLVLLLRSLLLVLFIFFRNLEHVRPTRGPWSFVYVGYSV